MLSFIKKFFNRNDKIKLSYKDLLRVNEQLKKELNAAKEIIKQYELKDKIKEDYEELKKTPVFVFNTRDIYKEIRKSEDPRSIFIITENLKKLDLDNLKKQEENLKKFIFYSLVGVVALSLTALFGYFGYKGFTSYNPPVKVINQYVLVDGQGNILGVYKTLEEAGVNKNVTFQESKKENPPLYTPPIINTISNFTK